MQENQMRRRSMFATLSKKWSRNQRTRRRSTTNTRSSSSNNISAANNPEKIGMKLAGGESDNALPQVMKDSVSSTTMLPRDASQFSIQNNNSRFVCLIFYSVRPIPNIRYRIFGQICRYADNGILRKNGHF